MIQKLIFIFSIIVILSVEILFSQTTENDYVILTVEIDKNKDFHGTFVYYWIIPIDSIDNWTNYNLCPVYLHSNFSSDSFEDCCNKKSVDIFTATTKTKYEFEDSFEIFEEECRNLVEKNRQHIQTISKKWNDNYIEKIKIFATPITGTFCYCPTHDAGLRFIDKVEIIYLPKDKLEYIDNFWNTEKSKIVKHFDYSYLNYRNSEYRTYK